MCPHGYHHSGSMANPALGTRDVRLHIVWIALWSHQSAQTASSERCIVQKVNVPQGGSPPNSRECSNCTGSERNIQRITICPHGYHHIYIYIYIYIYIRRNESVRNKNHKNDVKNNVGRIFLGIVNSSFPEGHALKPIFNRNTLKLSYSCMPNVKNAIDAHNKAQLKKPAAEPPKNCNCRDKPNCSLNGECRAKSIVYQASVTTPRTGPNNTNNCHSETYVGLTDTEFKLRYANHKQSFSNQRLRNATELSKYIWSLKEKNI